MPTSERPLLAIDREHCSSRGASITNLTSSWNYYIEGITELGEAILASGWKPTAILAIARGGLIPGAMLAYMLGVRRILAIESQHYDSNRSRFESGPRLFGVNSVLDSLDVNSDRLLIVDDIIDTGETIKLIRDETKSHAQEIKVAALYVRSNQKHAADWYWKIEDEWVVFPWALKD